jgi:uncharacterized repeat protein (TIGR01451 family)
VKHETAINYADVEENRTRWKVHSALSLLLASILTFTGLWPFAPLPIAVGQTTQACGIPGKDGPLPLTGVVNTYFSGNSNVAAGATSISLDAAVGSSNSIAVGDLLLFIQMQGADLNSDNTGAYGDGVANDPARGQLSTNFTAGLYEYVVATSAVSMAGGTVSIRSGPTGGGLLNTYTNANNTGGTSQGQRRFQVIRVPQYASTTLTSGLTATPWNGKAGGLLALDVAGQMNLGGATVSSGQIVTTVASDQTPGIDPGTECVPVLNLTKVTSPTVGPVSINNTGLGTTATYSITVSNAAFRSTATNVAISDPLPSGFSYASTGTIILNGGATQPTPSNPTGGDTTPSWGTFAIPAGGSVSIPFTVNIAASVPGGTYQNSATATYLDPARIVVTGTTSASYNSASSTGEDVTILPPSPRLRLVKRITALRRSSVNILPLTYIDIGTGTGNGDDNALGWPNAPAPVTATIDSGPSTNASFSPFLQGAINHNDARPNDEVEYTIYFLSDGGRNAGTVKLCDFVPANNTYVSNTFQLFQNGTLNNLTDAADGIDQGKFITNSFDAACAGTNNGEGAVFVELGTVNRSTGPGTPATSYGFIRFRAKVN